MKLFVDNQAVEDGFVVDTTTVEETLQHVQANLCDDDHLVVGIQCDGREVPAERMPDKLRERAQSFERLDIFTDTKTGLVSEAMSQASACLGETEQACKQAADLLTEGRTVEAAETLGECLRAWQQIHDAVAKSITMLAVDPEAFTVEDKPLVEAIGRPRDALLQVRDALLARDYVCLADLLQYEFGAVTSCWRSIVDALYEHSQRVRSAG